MRRVGQRDRKRDGRTDGYEPNRRFSLPSYTRLKVDLSGGKLAKGIEVAQVCGLFPVHSNEAFIYGLNSFSRKSMQTILCRRRVTSE